MVIHAYKFLLQKSDKSRRTQSNHTEKFARVYSQPPLNNYETSTSDSVIHLSADKESDRKIQMIRFAWVNIKIQIILLKLMWHKLCHSIRLIQYPLEKSFVRFKYLKNLQLHLHRLNPRPKGYLFKEPLYFLKATVTTNRLQISQYSRNLHKNAHSLSRLQQKIQPSARKFQKLLILNTEIRFQLKNQTIQSNIFQV